MRLQPLIVACCLTWDFTAEFTLIKRFCLFCACYSVA